jgi:hypothetical protein
LVKALTRPLRHVVVHVTAICVNNKVKEPTMQLRFLGKETESGNDFWLLDEHTVMFNHFSGDGVPLGQEVTSDPAAAELCDLAFEAVWALATPHDQYRV